MTRSVQHFLICILLSTVIFSGCSRSDSETNGPQILEVAPNSRVYLVYEDNGELMDQKDAIEQILRETFDLIKEVMPMTDVEIKIFVDPGQTISEIGIGGFAPNGSEVHIYINPNFNGLAQSISTELGPLFAHEMHHVKRWRGPGYGITLLEAIISEGLADHFSVEVMGIGAPIWSVAVSGEELENLLNIAQSNWVEKPYDHPKWFFGTTSDVPRWTGYSLGYRLVGEYLLQFPDKKPSNLFNEPADSFVQ